MEEEGKDEILKTKGHQRIDVKGQWEVLAEDICKWCLLTIRTTVVVLWLWSVNNRTLCQFVTPA